MLASTVVALVGITAALMILDLVVWALSALLGVQDIPSG